MDSPLRPVGDWDAPLVASACRVDPPAPLGDLLPEELDEVLGGEDGDGYTTSQVERDMMGMDCS